MREHPHNAIVQLDTANLVSCIGRPSALDELQRTPIIGNTRSPMGVTPLHWSV